MRARNTTWLLSSLIPLLPAATLAQTLLNPDISVIGDMRYLYRDNVAAARAGQHNTSFEFEELELNFSNHLNPYVRADVFLAIHGVEGPIEVEEIYSTVLRGLPVQLRFGKYFLDAGKLNTEHPHQWAWLDYPLMHQSFFGEEGARVVGVNARRLQGVGDAAVTISAHAFRSDFFGGHDHGEESPADAHDSEGEARIGYSGRLSLFTELNETNFLEIGGSYLYAKPEFEHDITAQVTAADITYKWRPDTYRAVKVRAEGMLSDREMEDETTAAITTVTSLGAFAAAEVKFRKRFDTGGFFDWAQDGGDGTMDTTAFGVFFGFMPVEETIRYSIVMRRETSDLYEGSSNSIRFQVLWSLGPHKPHTF